MKYECNVVQDLLPLYKDDVCSDETKKIVKEHLEECENCRTILDKLSDTHIDELIVREKDEVITSQSKYFKRKSALAGSIIAGVFAIPILVCLIVNLASGHALTWFFIVLAAMLIPSSLFVVPLMATKNRMFLTMTSFTASVILLLGVVSIYTHGRWFITAAPAVLFGLTMVFGPFIACRRPVNEYLGNKKGLVAMAADTITFFLMMFCIGINVSSPNYYPMAFAISVPLVIMAWLMFLIIRYLPGHGLTKAGVCIAAFSIFGYAVNRVIEYFILHFTEDTVVSYTSYSVTDLIIGLLVGAVFAGIGMVIYKGKNNTEAE